MNVWCTSRVLSVAALTTAHGRYFDDDVATYALARAHVCVYVCANCTSKRSGHDENILAR